MNKKVKKIAAREFLILLVLIVLTSLIFVCVFPYNSYQKKKIEEIDKSLSEKEKLTENLNKSVNEKIKKQESFKKSLEQYGKKLTDKQSNDFWLILSDIQKKDSIIYRWNNSWETNDLKGIFENTGLKNGKELNEFIKNYSLTKEDSIVLKKSETIREEIGELAEQKTEFKNKILNDNDKLDFIGGIGIILLGILFILRYLIYAVKWSLKTLKEN